MVIVGGLIEFLEYGGEYFIDFYFLFFVEVLDAVDEQFAAYVACVLQVFVLFSGGLVDYLHHCLADLL